MKRKKPPYIYIILQLTNFYLILEKKLRIMKEQKNAAYTFWQLLRF